MVLYERQHPASGFGRRSAEIRRGFAEMVQQQLAAAAPAKRAVVRARAVFGLWLVDTAAQQAILMDKLAGYDDRQLERELSVVWLAYMEGPETPALLWYPDHTERSVE
jgi:hypothetical protein